METLSAQIFQFKVALAATQRIYGLKILMLAPNKHIELQSNLAKIGCTLNSRTLKIFGNFQVLWKSAPILLNDLGSHPNSATDADIDGTPLE